MKENKYSIKKVLLISFLTLVILVGGTISAYMLTINTGGRKVETKTNEANTETKDEVTTIKSEQDLQKAKQNLTEKGSDNTKEDEAKLKSFMSQ
ncbi:hypothetical protein C4544_06415 [candidate division WS5 bacterium]|uniref:Uncharacterized protein n=1 Tax=candidate division WS5 bacterium TaxID=2093353 RepID=A0A419DA32_9BACT|nr:MAG: hypothetical protein C4544_06415 [candidate division WS5 bacterium]